jgi:predicted metalloprotease with PDZ domain
MSVVEPHQYRICPVDPAAHLFEVSVTISQPEPAGQLIAIAAWVPGSYRIRDLARHVVGISANTDEAEVSLTKRDKSTWQADVCESPLTVTLQIHAYDRSVRGAHLDTTHGFFDGAAVFPAVVGQENVECHVEICRPPTSVGNSWRVATAMQSLDAGSYDFGTYIARDYAELIDHPVEMGDILLGEFEVNGIPHVIAFNGHSSFDMARICHDLTTLCEAQMGFLGKPDDLDRYLFLVAVKEDGYGGLEHRWSSALMCSRRDLPRRGESKVSDNYRKFLGLCSHEYFHLWNVKRMKPECFDPYDLTAETHTGLLWVFEGITSYYDDLFLARSGLVSADSFLELLGQTITRVRRTPGRLRQDIQASSFDAWTKLYQADSNSPNAMISYYAKGALVGLALDMTIRKESDGEFSLDDVMLECWRRHADTGMPERGLESIARSVTGLELEDFFDRFVRGTLDLPLPGLLKTVGVDMRMRPTNDRKDLGGKEVKDDIKPPLWLGATLVANGGSSRFKIVLNGGPAERAGIAPGDEPVAIDGLRLNAANVDSRLRDYHAGDTVTVTVFRDHQLMRCRVTLASPPDDTCFLMIDDECDAAAAKQRDDWLGQP